MGERQTGQKCLHDFMVIFGYEYQMTVEINQPDQSWSQATVYGYFPNNQLPRRGQYLSLRIHPRDSKIVVLAKAATE